MGLGGISIWQLLIVLLIVVMIFGTKRLKDIGQDLGGAVKGFKKAMGDAETDADAPRATTRHAGVGSPADSKTRFADGLCIATALARTLLPV